MNVHIQLFPSGLLLIEDFHTELLHTEKLHTELAHTEISHRAATQRDRNLCIIAETNCAVPECMLMVNNRLSYFSVVFVERHLRYRDVV